MAPTKHPTHQPNVIPAVNTEMHLSLGNGYAYSHYFRLTCQHGRDTDDNSMNTVIHQEQQFYMHTSERNHYCRVRMILYVCYLYRFKKQMNRTAMLIVGIELYMMVFWPTV